MSFGLKFKSFLTRLDCQMLRANWRRFAVMLSRVGGLQWLVAEAFILSAAAFWFFRLNAIQGRKLDRPLSIRRFNKRFERFPLKNIQFFCSPRHLASLLCKMRIKKNS